jgi:hypothetical protein
MVVGSGKSGDVARPIYIELTGCTTPLSTAPLLSLVHLYVPKNQSPFFPRATLWWMNRLHLFIATGHPHDTTFRRHHPNNALLINRLWLFFQPKDLQAARSLHILPTNDLKLLS